MSNLDITVGKARSRLTFNRWLNLACVWLACAAGSFSAIVLLVRLYGWSWPLGWVAVGLSAVAVAGSLVGAWASRVDALRAAAALDEAAGLRERLSSGYSCRGGDDVFEQAVVVSAESTCANLDVGSHLRMRFPSRFTGAAVSLAAAGGMLLLPVGILRGSRDERETEAVAQRTATAIKKRTEEITRLAQTHPELKEAAEELDKLGESAKHLARRPEDVRNQALTKLDKLQDALKQAQEQNKFDHAKEFKKMLRGLKSPDEPQNPTAKIAKSLSAGDFKAAKEQIKQMQEQLATLPQNEDTQKLKELAAQLNELANKLDAATDDKKLKEQLEQAGIKKEDLERMLKNLTKKDLEQVKEQLEKQGLSQKALEQLAKQLEQSAGAKQLANQLAQSLKQAGAAAASSQGQNAADSLEGAAGQLGELEMLEQEMNQVESLLSDVQSAKNDLSKSCSQCDGSGQKNGGPCSTCGGSGGQGDGGSGDQPSGGMGEKPGRGRGGIAPEEPTPGVGYVKQREKVHSGAGAIIGQYLVDGEQIKGEISADLHELVVAGQRDAADAIQQKRIPRQYHGAIKKYFSDLEKEIAKRRPPEAPKPAPEAQSPGDEGNP